MTLLQRLREAGSRGLDLSPGDALCREAADEIQEMREALIKIEVMSYQALWSGPSGLVIRDIWDIAATYFKKSD